MLFASWYWKRCFAVSGFRISPAYSHTNWPFEIDCRDFTPNPFDVVLKICRRTLIPCWTTRFEQKSEQLQYVLHSRIGVEHAAYGSEINNPDSYEQEKLWRHSHVLQSVPQLVWQEQPARRPSSTSSHAASWTQFLRYCNRSENYEVNGSKQKYFWRHTMSVGEIDKLGSTKTADSIAMLVQVITQHFNWGKIFT